jgi:hypothetical protein
MTFLAAVRVDRIDTPCVFDAPINGESFQAMSSRSRFQASSPVTS